MNFDSPGIDIDTMHIYQVKKKKSTLLSCGCLYGVHYNLLSSIPYLALDGHLYLSGPCSDPVPPDWLTFHHSSP